MRKSRYGRCKGCSTTRAAGAEAYGGVAGFEGCQQRRNCPFAANLARLPRDEAEEALSTFISSIIHILNNPKLDSSSVITGLILKALTQLGLLFAPDLNSLKLLIRFHVVKVDSF